MNSTTFNIIVQSLIKGLSFAFIAIAIVCLVSGIIDKCGRKVSTTTSPVESIQIDSIAKENDKLIIEVEHLDSIKDAKVIEVKSLDNDSTLKLFYKLIGK
jgi:hypothetical protein